MEALTPECHVDQFRIIRKFGQGGMSKVYLARDTTLGRKVVLKIIRADVVDSPRLLKLFLREAHVTAQFSHRLFLKQCASVLPSLEHSKKLTLMKCFIAI